MGALKRPQERNNMQIRKKTDLEMLATALRWAGEDFLRAAENRAGYATKKNEDSMARFYRGQYNHSNSILKRVEKALTKIED